jgi:O-antigen ligase
MMNMSREAYEPHRSAIPDEPRSNHTGSLAVFLVFASVTLVSCVYLFLGFWAALAGLAAVAASVFLFTSPRTLFLTILVAKPLIDMLWFASIGGAGVTINAQSVVTVLVLVASLGALVAARVDLSGPLLVPVLLMTAVNLWALVYTPDIAAAEYFIRLVCGFPLLFFAPAFVRQAPKPSKMLKLFFLTMAFVCLTVMLQPLGVIPYASFDQQGTLSRATGFYYHPWDVARYMIILIPLAMAALDDSRRYRSLRGLPLWLLLALGLTVTFFTYLKAAWIAVLFQIVLWFFLTGRKRMAFFIAAICAALVAFPLRSGFVSVFSDLWNLSDARTRGQALSGRVFLWSQYWDGLRDASIRDVILGQGYRPRGIGTAVHDDYLRLLVMNGVLGLVVYLGLLVAVLRSLMQAVRRLAARRGIEWRIGIAVECLFAAYVLMGITADPSSYPSLTLYLWLLVGLVLGYAFMETERSTGDSS